MGSRVLLLLPALGLLAGCGGGGSSPPVTISGRLSIAAAPAATALRAPPGDIEPNDRAATARLLRGPPEGRLDARRDPVDAFRLVAAEGGDLEAVLLSEGVEGEAILHDLARGIAARSLRLEPGDVYDVVVVARRGAGPYRVLLREGAAGQGPRALPQGYLDCGDGFAPGEIVASPAPGVDARALEEASGLRCEADSRGLCLLRDASAPAARDFGGLCALLARCARLEAAGLVRFAEPNHRRRLAGLPDDPLFPQQWALPQVRAPAAWELATGSGAVVAIVDSGVLAHPDLVANLVPGWDFEGDDDDPTDPNRSLSHGTQVAGVVAAVGDNGEGVTGVLWSARLMPLRAFDAAGFGTAFDISNAILYAAGLDNESGTLPAERASVVNLSFASTVATASEADACARARAGGLFLCAASGNSGSTAIHYPAGYDGVVAVGATTSDGRRAAYSNHGDWIDIVAPGGVRGDGVLTAGILPGGQIGYPRVEGTSFASPHVAAVASLCMGLAPLTPLEVEQILLSNAQDVGLPGRDDETGHGIVDAYRAALGALDIPVPPLYPYEEVEVRLLRVADGSLAAATRTGEAQALAWSLADVPPGRYILEAGTDRDLDGSISGPGELHGRWRDEWGRETLVVGAPRSDLDIPLATEE